MSQISSSEDVYRQLVDESEEHWLFGLVAFAIVEEQRVDWMKHYNEHNGRLPNSNEIHHWYQQQPPGVILRAKGTAENALKLYADDVLQEVMEMERREVEEGLIVSEIRQGRRFWPMFGTNVAAGFASAVLFAAVLVVLAFFVLTDASILAFVNKLDDQRTEEKLDGEADSKSGSNE